LLCDLYKTLCRDLLATFGDCLLVLLFNSSTNCGYATHQNLFCNCALSFWKFCENCINIHTAWLDALWLWTLRQFWGSLKERTTRTVSTAFSTFTALTTWLVTIATLSTWLVTITARTTALVTITGTLLAKLLCHCFKGLL
jgi:hypothetical protein